MRWGLIAGSVLVLGAGALLATADRAPPDRAPAVAAAPPLPPADAAPAPAPAAPARPPAAAAPAAPQPSRALEAPAARAELPIDPTARVRALEPLRRQVIAALAELRWRVARCETPESTVFVTLETLEGAVRIVDARVVPLPPEGDPGDGEPAPVDERVAHCVRSALVQNVLAATAATPGRRWEMPFAPGAPE